MGDQDVRYVTIWDCEAQTCMYCGYRGDAMTDGKLVWCRSPRACIQRLVDQNAVLRRRVRILQYRVDRINGIVDTLDAPCRTELHIQAICCGAEDEKLAKMRGEGGE